MNAAEMGLGLQTLQILGWALLHSLWIGTLIGMVFALLRPLVRDHISMRYWLGVGCLLAFASIEFAMFVNALLSAISLPPPLEFASVLALSTNTELDNTGVALPFALQDGALPLTMLIGCAWLLGVGISIGRLLRSHRALRLLALAAKSDADSALERLCRC